MDSISGSLRKCGRVWEQMLTLRSQKGMLYLFGSEEASGTIFRLVTIDTLGDLLEEEPPDPLNSAACWEEALAVLDRYHWTRFYPTEAIHPDLKGRIWTAVLERAKDLFTFKKWIIACDITI